MMVIIINEKDIEPDGRGQESKLGIRTKNSPTAIIMVNMINLINRLNPQTLFTDGSGRFIVIVVN